MSLSKDPSYRTIFKLMTTYAEGDAMEMYTNDGVVTLTYRICRGSRRDDASNISFFETNEMKRAIELKARELESDDPGRRGWVGIKLSNSPTFAPFLGHHGFGASCRAHRFTRIRRIDR